MCVLVPLISLLLAAVISALVICWPSGKARWRRSRSWWTGALGSAYGWGYTLYYATTLHLHRAGGDGRLPRRPVQHRRRGAGAAGRARRGAGLPCACPGRTGRWRCSAAMIGAALFGAAWAAIPAYLQAKRGSHIVITTIMFNFIASALMIYLLVNVLRPRGRWTRPRRASPRARTCPRCTRCPACRPALHQDACPPTSRCSSR